MSIDELIATAESLQPNASNCLGTALFLFGLEQEDLPLTGHQTREILIAALCARRVTISKHPLVHSLAVFGYNSADIYHAGIVTGIDPCTLVHREYFDGPVHINEVVDLPYDDLRSDFQREFGSPDVYFKKTDLF